MFYHTAICFMTPPYRQPHAVIGGLVSISGGCMLLCKDIVVVAEDSPHITIRLIETVNVTLVYLLVPVCCRHGPGQDRYIETVNVTLVYLLVSVCCRHGPSQDRYIETVNVTLVYLLVPVCCRRGPR